MNVESIITIVLGVILVTNLLSGFSRGFSRALLRLITLVVAMAGAFCLAKWGASTILAQSLTDVMRSSAVQIEQLFTDAPEIEGALQAIITVFAAPILFFFCYVVLKIVTLIVYWILKGIVIKKKEKTMTSRLGGLGIGLLIGILGMTAILTPVMGYVHLGDEIITHSEMVDEETVEMYHEYMAPLDNAPLATPVYNMLAKPLFNGLTTTKWDGVELSLRHELEEIVLVMEGVSNLAGNTDLSTYGEGESAALHKISLGIGESAILSHTGAGFLNHLSNAWLCGEDFLGTPKPGDGGNADIILNGFLRVFSTSDYENIGGDMDAFAELFDLLAKHKMFELLGEGVEEGDFVKRLSESGFLDEAMLLLNAHPRLKPVVDAFSDAGMRLLMREVGLPEEFEEEFPELLDEMTTLVQGAVTEEGEIDTEAISTDLKQAFVDHNVDVQPSAADLIAEGIAKEFTAEELQTLSQDEIKERLLARLGTVEGKETIFAEGIA